MAKMRVGVYPGTFDPITNGHTDIILRATRLVDKLVIGVARNAGKGPIFSTDERVAIVRRELAELDNGAHDQLMAEMQSIKHTERQDSWALDFCVVSVVK